MLELLDVAIGVIFLFLVMSLIASAVMELIEIVLHYRSRDLYRGIKDLLGGDPAKLSKLYDHPLISNLFEGEHGIQVRKWWKQRGLPPYIPARNFALALMSILDLPVDTATPADPAKSQPINVPDAIKNATAGVEKAVKTLIAAAANDAAKARENIEEWFNSSMDRVSGWYKQRTQIILVAIGILAAAVLNVDSIRVATELVRDRPLREATVAAAEEYAKADATTANASASQKLDDQLTKLKKLGLPIGREPLPSENAFEWWLKKIAGILITAAAVTLGAPFWFDVLNKFIVVRSTVKPKEKSGLQGSKDAQS